MRGRFAPSPTGRLHLGNARTALLAWLQARAAGGAFLLRIEDLDPARSRAELVDEVMRDLEYLGLTWDERPLRQSERAEAYAAALTRLRGAEEVYPCFCSRAEISRAASAPHGPSDDGPRYPGTCARLSQEQRDSRASKRSPSWRFRAPDAEVHFMDLFVGPTSQNVQRTVGDYVVQRADGVASYQLAVVVDDAETHVTHVLRGDDLLTSTPRQLLLYRALSLEAPSFAHVPLVAAADGGRLAKREGAYAIASFRERRVASERVVGLLAGLCGWSAEPITAEALADRFRLEDLPRAPALVTDRLLEPLL